MPFPAPARHPRTAASAALAALLLAALALPAPAAGEEYLIGGGDVLQVNVWKNPELTQTVTVRPDGCITLPLVRDVTAAGLSAMALGKVVAERLAAFVNAPNVTVTVASASGYRVYTQGALAGGMHTLTAPTTARQLLSRAGGGAADADLARAYVLRGGDRVPVDLSPAAGARAGAEDPVLQAGDVLVVPVREVALGRVLVAGEVARPQAIAFQEGMTFLDAYLGAGAGTPSADLAHARVSRRGEGGATEIRVNLEELLRTGALERNIELQPGDILFVPYRAPAEPERVLVVGEVRAPKSVPFREGMTVLDAFAEAGGGTEFADLSALKVVRRSAGGAKEAIGIDLRRALNKADLGRNIALVPGDILVVPR